MSDSTDGQRRALLVGVNNYNLDDHIGNLQYCVNDVVELDTILSEKQRGNFSSSQLIHSETNNEKSLPTRSNILNWISLLAKNSKAKDTILFYFAGHGFEKESMNYLLPSDSRLNILSETAIPLKWIKETINQAPARKKFMIIDACHSGATIGRSSSLPMTRSFEQGMFSEAEGLAILSSCRIGQLSYDYREKNHGVFSYYLLEGLRGLADTNADGIITVPDANNYVTQKLHEWSLENETQQNPRLDYDVSGDFIFVKVPIKGNLELHPKPAQTVEKRHSEDQLDIFFRELAFNSDEEIISNYLYFIEIRNYLTLEDKTQSRRFLIKLFETRFSSLLANRFLMPIVGEVTEITEIKKWLEDKPKMKGFFILEFITSGNFEYAGTMARIIKNLLPAFTDYELMQIIKGIESNGQIISSFKARNYLWSIIDSAKNLMSLKKYREFKNLFYM